MAQFKSPKVIFNEIDNSAFALNVYNTAAAVCIRARRGPIEPMFISSLKKYKDYFTVTGKFEMDLTEHYSFAAFMSRVGSSAWVQRVVPDDATYGGVVIFDVGQAGPNAAISAGLASPEAYTFNEGECLLITGADPGAWNNNLKVIVTNVTTSGDESVTVEVYETVDGTDWLRETQTGSLVEGTLDGFGRNMYLPDMFAESRFIRIRHNAASTALNTLAQATKLAFAEGADGSAIADADIAAAYDVFLNTDEYKIAYMVQLGIGGTTTQLKMISVAEQRKDCMAFIDAPIEADTVAELLTFRNTTLAADTSYGFLYAPWILLPDYDNDRSLFVAPSGVDAGLTAETYYTKGPWFSEAGLNRGVIPALGLSAYFDESDQDELSQAQVNIFRKFPGRYVLWDDRSLQVKATALSYKNVRGLMIVLRTTLHDTALQFLFEPLTTDTQVKLVAAFDDYLRTVQIGQGITAYRVVSDPLGDPNGNNPPNNIDNGILTVDVLLVPVKAIRGILINATITRSGVNLEEVGTVPINEV